MKKEIFKTIDIPEGIEVTVDDSTLNIKGPEGENKREFKIGKLKLTKENKDIKIGSSTATKREKKIINTIVAHIKNMISGVKDQFVYKLKICSSHFPISVEKKEDSFIIKNFLGEKVPRFSKIPKKVEAEMSGDFITIKSSDKELAGQTAANLETATRVKKRDLRVFQDGIFIIEKNGRAI